MKQDWALISGKKQSKTVFFFLFYLAVMFHPAFLLAKGGAPLADKEAPIDNLRPLYEPIEPARIPAYMGKVPPPRRPKNPPLPYKGLHKGPATVTMCLNVGLACYRPENIEEWQALYRNSSGEPSIWHSPWGRDYLIPKGFNHREDWVRQWEEAQDNCTFEQRCHFPAFVKKARKNHKEILQRFKAYKLKPLFQPFFQPTFLRLESKGDLQFQCDKITLVCTPFIHKENRIEGIYRPFMPFSYVTDRTAIMAEELKKKKAAKEARKAKSWPQTWLRKIGLGKEPKDLSENTGYLGSEAQE